jgi:hypothetical protein
MKYASEVFICLILACLLLHSCFVGAEPFPLAFKNGEPSIGPPHPSIRLDSEETVISLAPRTYVIDAISRFFNSGDSVSQWVGFPKPVSGPVEGDPAFCFISFEAWVDDRKLTTAEDEHLQDTFSEKCRASAPGTSSPNSGFLAANITFPGHAETMIRVRYRAPYTRSAGANLMFYAIYGERWEGKMRKAIVVIDSSRVGGNKKLSTSLWPSRQPNSIGETLVK